MLAKAKKSQKECHEKANTAKILSITGIASSAIFWIIGIVVFQAAFSETLNKLESV